MKKSILIILFFFISYSSSFACLNGAKKELKNGYYLYMDYNDRFPFGHHFFDYKLEKVKHELDSIYKKTNDSDYLSDLGLILILQKKYKQALELYLNIEKTNPNKYSTASNIGTIYELIGENKKALEWINKSILINPKSHNESEWLHSKILEAKIKGEDYHTSNFLLGLNFGNEDIPISNQNKTEINKLYKSIFYQLNERISFIKPKDKIIAILLFDLGNISILKGKFTDAKIIFEKSKEYGLDNDLLKKRLKYVNSYLQPKITNQYTYFEKIDGFKTVVLILGFTTIGILLYLLKKHKKQS